MAPFSSDPPRSSQVGGAQNDDSDNARAWAAYIASSQQAPQVHVHVHRRFGFWRTVGVLIVGSIAWNWLSSCEDERRQQDNSPPDWVTSQIKPWDTISPLGEAREPATPELGRRDTNARALPGPADISLAPPALSLGVGPSSSPS